MSDALACTRLVRPVLRKSAQRASLDVRSYRGQAPAALLGHSTPEITREIYLHAVPEEQRRAVESVERLVFGPQLECAGINRREVANARVVQVRRSEPTWPRVMRGQSKGCT
jgi:hypothetical protein